ncbi:ABC transporter ATP-binding protein [Nitrolancea hollandica]|uniref:ABC transporter related protein n=1 Tax=Nitrolancea hollandica Lb TaxID=1129897 RepID=I4EJR0_9BACT|nr:ABC transporter ATP-binding protein [Nitrolancea hollandica]CCF84922.1 ABC transporter related protein [Nitrolancea hollandica Lb]
MARSSARPVRQEDAVIEFRDVSRRFVLRHESRASFQDWFIGLIRPRGKGEEFWALRDVSFSVRRGESLGVIGRNGAGKSTLLKLVTRILEPTSGKITIRGRTHAMLELGAGFHPELSGRDNVYLNGSIYGFSRREMSDRFDQIVEFAELERFIDTPVKHYSSGMFMRLGFSIAAHMDPDILVIDEVLAVGDASFQRKSHKALQDLKANGTTILFVSHNPEQVRGFCDRAILLQHGQLVDFGPSNDVVDHYLRLLRGEETRVTLLRVRAIDQLGAPVETAISGEDLGIEVLLRVPDGTSTAGLLLALDLHDQNGTHLFGNTGELPAELPLLDAFQGDTRRVRARIGGLPLGEGPLTVSVSLQRSSGGEIQLLDRQEIELYIISETRRQRGILQLDHTWDWEIDGDTPGNPADTGLRFGSRRPG